MTLPTSGALTLENIQTEFGGSNPIGLNEYYAGGGLVPAGTSGTYGAVPSSGTLSVQNFYGTTAYTPIYVDEVFSTVGYTGNGAAQTITNGIDLAGEGGLVWSKCRNDSNGHVLYDTARGPYPTASYISSNDTAAASLANGGAYAKITSFNSSGYTIGSTSSINVINSSSKSYVSWSFRKKAKFFDVVTYTGDGTGSRLISHNLGSQPGCIMVKATSGSGGDWLVYHKDKDGYTGFLNSTAAFASPAAVYGRPDLLISGANNATQFFAVGLANTSGVNYVAYLFAHDAGGFGPTGTDSVVSCGSYTGNGSTTTGGGPVVNVGFEPQWLLIKSANTTGNWTLIDSFRAMPATAIGYTGSRTIFANTNAVEADQNRLGITALPTGFQISQTSAYSDVNTNGQVYVYIAIRRTGEKVPTDATKVFNPWYYANSGFTAITRPTVNQPDLLISRGRVASYGNIPLWYDRMRGGDHELFSSNTSAQGYGYRRITNFGNNTVSYGADTSAPYLNGPGTFVNWIFTRARGFFDQVLYTGTGSALTLTHRLGVAPQLVITKFLSASGAWTVTAPDSAGNLLGNTFTDAAFGNFQFVGSLNASTVTAGFANSGYASTSGVRYVMYLFSSCPGVSSIGYYTGNGGSQTINCGFSAGARFVLLKRTDSTGNWLVWDTARGIVAADDPVVTLNTQSSEATGDDSIDPTGSGFIVNQTTTNNVNVSGGTYFYFAVA